MGKKQNQQNPTQMLENNARGWQDTSDHDKNNTDDDDDHDNDGDGGADDEDDSM